MEAPTQLPSISYPCWLHPHLFIHGPSHRSGSLRDEGVDPLFEAWARSRGGHQAKEALRW